MCKVLFFTIQMALMRLRKATLLTQGCRTSYDRERSSSKVYGPSHSAALFSHFKKDISKTGTCPEAREPNKEGTTGCHMENACMNSVYVAQRREDPGHLRAVPIF